VTLQTITNNKEPVEATKILKSLLKEDTGRHLLDSGDHYGRNHEENQGVDLEAQDVSTHDVHEYDGELEIIPSVSTYHFLKHRVEYGNEVHELNKQFLEFANQCDGSWLSVMEKAFGGCSVNTYNHEFHATDQILQFVAFDLEGVAYDTERDPEPNEFVIGDRIMRAKENIHGEFVALQIHGGCDVRGGYTAPVVFRARESAARLLDDGRTYVDCDVCGHVAETYETVKDGDWDQLELEGDHVVHRECGGSRCTLHTPVEF
jgi:hypothetical protein